MAKGKYASHRANYKLLALALALVLAFGGVIGGTVSWLIDAPDPVVNTFTYGDINITLEETDTDLDNDNDPNTNQYEMMPGQPIVKDPVITVKSGSETMWLFVKLEKSQNFDEFLTYTVDPSWVALENVDGVYYRYITAEEIETADLKAHVLAGDTVTVKETVTKEQLNALDENGASDYPTLTVTAYAVQYAGNPTAAEAWARINPPAAAEPTTEPTTQPTAAPAS